MTDVAKALEWVAGGPWRAMLFVVGSSFAVATVTSTLIGRHLLQADLTKPLLPPARVAGDGTFTVPSPSASLSQAAIDAIVRRNLFSSKGETSDLASPRPGGGAQKVADIPKSDLPFKLQGTIYGGDPFSGIAIVENDAKKTINSFMVGDSLTKDAIVKEIHRQRIIVDRSGRLEYLEVQSEALTRSRRKKKAAVTTAAANLTEAPLATEPPPQNFREDGFERKDRDMTMTQTYRQKLLTVDFTKVLQDAKATPNMVDGELKGFVLNRIRKDSIYEKAGFQNEDIVMEINGVPLTDTAQAIRLLQSLRNESEVEVRGVRGGAPLKFTLNVR